MQPFNFMTMFSGENLARLQTFFARGEALMNKIETSLERIDMRLDGIDSKLTTIVDGFPPAVTETVLSDGIFMSQNDPRNQDVIATSTLDLTGVLWSNGPKQ